jgi:hypothetical protein
MPLVTSKEMLLAALEGRFAVGAFNANNMGADPGHSWMPPWRSNPR